MRGTSFIYRDAIALRAIFGICPRNPSLGFLNRAGDARIRVVDARTTGMRAEGRIGRAVRALGAGVEPGGMGRHGAWAPKGNLESGCRSWHGITDRTNSNRKGLDGWRACSLLSRGRALRMGH
jgi:hypothetical protein